MLRHPQYLAVHKNGGSATDLELMLQIHEVSSPTFIVHSHHSIIDKVAFLDKRQDSYISISLPQQHTVISLKYRTEVSF
ncbi:MAG: hypothetical protein MJE68_29845 [Proteobacteria bacterium]|nr:hypothetical protein [Pseudomonadota bacterium]